MILTTTITHGTAPLIFKENWKIQILEFDIPIKIFLNLSEIVTDISQPVKDQTRSVRYTKYLPKTKS